MSIFTKRAPRNPDLIICDECLSCEYNRTAFTDCPNCYPPFLPGEADALLDSIHQAHCESCGYRSAITEFEGFLLCDLCYQGAYMYRDPMLNPLPSLDELLELAKDAAAHAWELHFHILHSADSLEALDVARLRVRDLETQLAWRDAAYQEAHDAL